MSTATDKLPTPNIKTPEPERLDVLAAQIKQGHALLNDNTRNIVQRAIAIGEALNEAKDKIEYSQWLPWLKAKCELPERTAQRYMKLANNKTKLMEKMKSATMADLDLTLNEAQRMIEEATTSATPGAKGPSTSSNSEKKTTFDRLEKLWADAPLSDQQRFVREEYNELAKLMKEVDRETTKKAA
jgi:hypothetical protein